MRFIDVIYLGNGKYIKQYLQKCLIKIIQL